MPHTHTHIQISLTILTLTMAAPFAYATRSSTPNSMPHRKGNILINLIRIQWERVLEVDTTSKLWNEIEFYYYQHFVHDYIRCTYRFFFIGARLAPHSHKGLSPTQLSWNEHTNAKKKIRNYRNYAGSWYRFWFRRWCNHVSWQFWKHLAKK